MANEKTKFAKRLEKTIEEEQLPPDKKEKLAQYRKENDRKLKELEYELRNGIKPQRAWYEEDL